MHSAIAAGVLQIEVSMWDFRSHRLWLWLVAGLIGGWLFDCFGIMGGDFYYSLGAATAGAIVLVGISRLFGGEPKK
jgi:uncharacterized membrane protein YeaQ/YmgE (transglycosylase-associated protein family)